MRKLKEFYITFDPDDFKSGIDMIALTDTPAIELTALRFTEQSVEEFSYTDYPQAVRDNAARGVRLNEAQDNQCATQVGKVRAQQLANGEPVSLDTVKRMFSYLSRAKEFYNPEDTEACGTISYLLWGGEEALNWSKRIVDQENQEMQKQLGFKFSIDKEKQVIAGPVMIPNKKIYRKDKENGEYYVIFTEEVIEKMVEKFQSEKRDTIFNMQHNSDDTIRGFIKGSWIVEDPDLDKAVYYGFKDLPVGTFFVEAKIEDQEEWNKLKDMDQVGFSVEGLMGLFNSQIINRDKSQTFKNKKKMKNKRKFVAFKLVTKKMFNKDVKRFEEVLVSDEEEVLIVENLEVGAGVEILNEDAEMVAAEDGTYVIESQEVEVTIEDGEITAVEDMAAEDAESDNGDEDNQEFSEDEDKERKMEEETSMTVQLAEMLAKMAEFEARLETLEGNVAEQEEAEETAMQFSKQTRSDLLSTIKTLTK